MGLSRAFILLLGMWLLSCTISPAWALTIEAQQQLDYADQLYSDQQYRRAAEEYQRFAFFFKNHPLRRETVYKSGQAFLMAGDTETALATFKDLAAQAPPDDIAIESDFMMVECYLQFKAPTQAVVQLHNIITQTDDVAVKDRAYYRLGWLYIDMTDWPNAERAMSQISAANRLHYRTTEIERLLSDSTHIPKKNPALAGTLSIVPGAGQLYCERYEDALIAFLVNMGLFWAASESFQEDQPALGGLLAFVGIGFYTGNIYGAVSDAHKYNRNRYRDYVDKFKPFQVRKAATRVNPSARMLLFSLHIPF